MQDGQGDVPRDSLVVFYSLIDTTHLHHSIQGNAWCYEYAGTDYLRARRTDTDKVVCVTETNEATHCALVLLLEGDTCQSFITLHSIATPGDKDEFYCDGGSIQIDRTAWKKGVLKAAFSLTFQNREEPQKPVYWRGRIYTEIEQEITESK